MAFCRKCGKEVSDGAKFCGSCGAATGVAASVPVAPVVNYHNNSDDVGLYVPPPQKPNVTLWSVLAIFLVIAFLLNPNEAKHQRAVAELAVNEFNNTEAGAFVDAMGELLGGDGSSFVNYVTNGIVQFMITSQSYGVFSLTKLRADGSTIGIGLFGHVFLFANELPLGGDDLFNFGDEEE